MMVTTKISKIYYPNIKTKFPPIIEHNSVTWIQDTMNEQCYTHTIQNSCVITIYIGGYTKLVILQFKPIVNNLYDSNAGQLFSFKMYNDTKFMYMLIEKFSYYIFKKGWFKTFLKNIEKDKKLYTNKYNQKEVFSNTDKIILQFFGGGCYI